jgi:hypothetical protein
MREDGGGKRWYPMGEYELYLKLNGIGILFSKNISVIKRNLF